MLDFYGALRPSEKALVWAAGLALIALVVVYGDTNQGVAAAAQVAAAVGTFVLAALALSQVREMKATRLAQETPQIIVDLDQSNPPFVYVVVRNIGQGSAKDISFEFSDPMEIPEGERNPFVIPVNEQGYFKKGIPYLAPGAEIRTFWGSMITLGDFLEEQGLEDGVTITSRYQSLSDRPHDEPHVTEWTVNPLLLSDRISTDEVGIKQVVEALDAISRDLRAVVDGVRGELQVSTDSERERRHRQSNGEGS